MRFQNRVWPAVPELPLPGSRRHFSVPVPVPFAVRVVSLGYFMGRPDALLAGEAPKIEMLFKKRVFVECFLMVYYLCTIFRPKESKSKQNSGKIDLCSFNFIFFRPFSSIPCFTVRPDGSKKTPF